MAGLGYNFKRILQQIAKILFVQIFYWEIQMKIQRIFQKIRNSIKLFGGGLGEEWVLQGY
jgi:hypothetical protein